MTSSQWAAVAIILLIVGAAIGYFAAPKEAAPTTCPPCPEATCPPCPEVPEVKKLKAAWVYVGPIGDIGWTYAHNEGREYVDNKFDWLETTYVESVSAGDLPRVIDQLIQQGYELIFTTSFEFMDPTLEKAKQYTDKIFFHCSGYKRWKNMGTYFADFYQIYYLNGLMAGALTKTKKIGYVAAHTIPEVVRHINAFAIGVKEVCPDCEVHVIKIGAWYDPTKARQAAETLIAEGCDVLAFTEDTPTVVEVAQEHWNAGEWVLAFGHYSPMMDYGPDVCVSGQIVHWEVIYEDIVTKVYLGVYTPENLENVDYWWLLKEGAVELGCAKGEPINPKFIDQLKAIMVTEKITGQEMSVYDLVMLRLQQMMEESPTFDPFTGPLYDNEGNLRALPGQRLGHDDLWTMQWWFENVIGPPLGG